MRSSVKRSELEGELFDGGLLVQTLSSTNTSLRANWDQFAPWNWLAARHQDGGRGRLGRPWHSPARTSLLVSVLVPTAEQPGLVSFAAALGLRRLIHEEIPSTNATLKWPNDLLLAHKKIAGILTEHIIEEDGTHWLAVGAGLNLTTPDTLLEQVRGTSLQQHGWSKKADDECIGALANRFSALMREELEAGQLPARFAANCSLQGKNVTALLPSGLSISGTVSGISDSGELLVDATPVSAADVTIAKEPTLKEQS